MLTVIGSIIFGGIDTKKYTGILEKRPFVPYNVGNVPQFVSHSSQHFQSFAKEISYLIYMTSIGITKPGEDPKLYTISSADPLGLPVVFDSGSTFSRLPAPLFNAILDDFPGATLVDPDSRIYQVDCSVGDQPGTVDFGFGDTIIRVPYGEFIWEAGPDACALGVVADTISILGGKKIYFSNATDIDVLTAT